MPSKKATSAAKSSKAATSKKSKTKLAPWSLNDDIAALLALVSKAPVKKFAQRQSEAKLFELVVLSDIVNEFVAHGGSAQLVSPTGKPGNTLYFAGSPSYADRSQYSHVALLRPGEPLLEAWVSVQISTLSWSLSQQAGQPPPSGKHEIDVGVFSTSPTYLPGIDRTNLYRASPVPAAPAYAHLVAAVSCKHKSVNKEAVREALGLRRETALLRRPRPTSVPWLKAEVPANPATPLFLASSTEGVMNFTDPVDRMGVFMVYLPFD